MKARLTKLALGLAMTGALIVTPLALTAAPASAWQNGGTQGCTPGYWKNHTSAWADTMYSPTDTVGSVFTLPANLASFSNETLLDALNGAGGSDLSGATEILLRAAVAGLLNATDSNLAYPARNQTIIKHVNAALATGDRDTILALATKLDQKNNLGCPLS